MLEMTKLSIILCLWEEAYVRYQVIMRSDTFKYLGWITIRSLFKILPPCNASLCSFPARLPILVIATIARLHKWWYTWCKGLPIEPSNHALGIQNSFFQSGEVSDIVFVIFIGSRGKWCLAWSSLGLFWLGFRHRFDSFVTLDQMASVNTLN